MHSAVVRVCSLEAVTEKGRAPAVRAAERTAERAEGRATLKHRAAIEAIVGEGGVVAVRLRANRSSGTQK